MVKAVQDTVDNEICSYMLDNEFHRDHLFCFHPLGSSLGQRMFFLLHIPSAREIIPVTRPILITNLRLLPWKCNMFHDRGSIRPINFQIGWWHDVGLWITKTRRVERMMEIRGAPAVTQNSFVFLLPISWSNGNRIHCKISWTGHKSWQKSWVEFMSSRMKAPTVELKITIQIDIHYDSTIQMIDTFE